MATNTYVALDKVTVGTATPSVTFSPIPQSYTNLVLIIQATTISANYNLRFNGDTSSNYSYTGIYGDGTSAVSYRSANNTVIGVTYTSSGAPTSIIQIQNYTSTNVYKPVLIKQDDATNAAMRSIGLWRKTPEAISSITILSGGNIPVGTTLSLYGITAASTSSPSAKATGGTIYYGMDGYTYHKFTSGGTFTPSQSLTADILVVAGGGGGGYARAGGGGAGGLLYFSQQALTATGYTVTVGGGGSAYTVGQDSQFGALTLVKGGGRGGSESGFGAGVAGGAGGSGGGSAGFDAPGAGTSGQGFAGGTAAGSNYGAGGGGGAGGIGYNGYNATSGGGGDGGIGTNFYANFAAITSSGDSGYFAGGGGGSSNTSPNGVGGLGGGGRGANNSGETGVAGTANTGGGGGGGYGSGSRTNGGAGGSGIVIVRYPS